MTICRTLIIAYRINKLGHTECPGRFGKSLCCKDFRFKGYKEGGV
nr:MAG TPA: protein of unknown function (DUF3903) [Caudoviricetes sp.]